MRHDEVMCTHKHCGKPVMTMYARWKWVEEHGSNMPFHTACSYAGPEWDVSKGCGSPFTTITGPDGVTNGQSA